MHSDGLVAISKEVADLDINEGPSKLSAFAGFEEKPPPAPKLQNQGTIAMDISEQFTDAAQKLDVGQLIKEPYFTLFESVGALEVMDRKMDSGYLEPGETMEDEYDFGQALLPEEIIGIIDQLLFHEMAWHKGHPLSQTIFTSLYIDRLLAPSPVSLDQTLFDRGASASDDESMTLRILRAYCLALIKTCWYVNSRVKSEHYYEEEDFVTHTFNRDLVEGLDHGAILQLLEDTTTLLSSSPEVSPKLKDALLCRLRFRATFLRTVEMANSRNSSASMKALWTELLDSLPALKSSTKLGKAAPTTFSVKLQRKLASTVPPRPIVHISDEIAFDHLERLCRDGSVAVEVLDYHDSHSLMTFVSLFQARKPQPSVYIRTLLQHYLFGDMIILGTMSIRQVLDEDLAHTVLPGNQLLDRDNDEIEVPSDPRFIMATKMEIFRSRAANSYLDILRTICQNRCRIRRTLAHTIADWDSLQLDAEELDVDLRAFTKEKPVLDESISTEPIYSFPLSSWAYFYKLQQMELVIQLGFELGTYAPDELARMYWYLKYISQTRSRHLERVKGFIVRAQRKALRAASVRIEKLQQYAEAVAFINFSKLEAASVYGFADALSCLFTALGRLELLQSSRRPYSDDSQRYEVRMKPFLSIGLPELVPFEELTELVTQPKESLVSILKFATDSAVGAKRAFEVMSKLSTEESFCKGSHESWLKNIKDCLKAVIFTNIIISKVKKAVEAAAKDEIPKFKVEIPESGQGYHDFWVVPKITHSLATTST
ncbi:mak10 [Hyphodiscus hymeniophilus]|uniref:Mak10 n=1 Tax=Hyphodiscus hymeniophilus TaxID=353542 RepID=A0A9P7AVY2_9HELO|nr:mak10 [Hyphodiscus hymeniophilus]